MNYDHKEQIVIPYLDMILTILVYIEDQQTKFVFQDPDQDSQTIVLTHEIDQQDKESWRENGMSTVRAEEIGNLIERHYA